MCKEYQIPNCLYQDSTYDIVSKVAYLIGIPKAIFENPHEPPLLSVFDRMNLNKSARIVRNLCRLRTAIERSFGRINLQMRTDFRSIYSMPEYVPQDAICELTTDGVSLHTKATEKLCRYVMEINRILCDRINNCKALFPVWLNWDHVRDLFLMKDGLTEAGTKAAANLYFNNYSSYPYGVYINWKPGEDGNILYNDKKFVTLLYQQHNDYFTDMSRVSDAGAMVKDSIHEFIQEAENIVMAVDCENSDPYRLCALLKGLDSQITCKIRKILLIDDVHTVDAWRILDSQTHIPVEHRMTRRIKAEKSLVDIELTAITCREHYQNQVDSFLIVSSDSDYWGLISTLPDARFLVMVEREKCGPDMKEALTGRGIFYCYLDDFYTGDGSEIRSRALFGELYRNLDRQLRLNVKELLDQALTATRIQMDPAEKKQFYDKYLRTMKLVLDEDGNASLEMNSPLKSCRSIA